MRSTPGPTISPTKTRSGDRGPGRRGLDATIGEWLLYVTHCSKSDARVARHLRRYLQISIKDRIQKKDEHRLEECFHGSIKNLKEPSIAETLELAKDYLHPPSRAEAILSMGKSGTSCVRGPRGW